METKLSNKRLSHEYEFRIQRLQNLFHALDNISNYELVDTSDFNTRLKRMTTDISETLNIDRVSVRLYNEDKSELISYAMYDDKLKESIEGISLKRQDYPLFFEYLESTLIIKVNNIKKQKELYNMINVFFSKDGMISSLLASKIVVKNDIKGYVIFQSRSMIHWDSEYVLFADLVANRIATIFINDELKKHQLILERKVIERTRQMQKAINDAHEANKSKSFFISKVSHEIRTPLTAIIGFLSLIEKENLDEKTLNYLNNISQGTETLLELINDILDFSKIEAGKMQPQMSNLNLSEFINQIKAFYQDIILDKSLSFAIQTDLKNNEFLTDGHFLRQIINNLIGNAIKFTHEGHIKLDVKEIIKDEIHSVIEMSVSDSGIGIHHNDYDKLFTEFNQLNQKQTYYRGTGLGLVITKNLVESLNGVIEVQSELGVGTSFKVIIPMKKSDSTNVGEPNLSFVYANTDFLKSYSILIVEDHTINQTFLRELLEPLCYKVTTANHGLEALKLVSEHTYHLIIMDLQMPVLDGITTTKIIRLHPSYRVTPIVAFSANQPHKEDLSNVFNSFMLKPITKDHLLFALHSAINQRAVNVDKSSSIQLNVLEFLHQIVNIKTKKGISYTGNDYHLYVKLLKTFIANNMNDMQLILKSIINQKNEEALRYLHTLKGSLLMFGIDFLHIVVVEIENEVKHNGNHKGLIQKVQRAISEYEITLSKIKYIIEFFERKECHEL